MTTPIVRYVRAALLRSWQILRFHGDWKALQGAVNEPAWRSKPSSYLVAMDDKMIPPAAQPMMVSRAGSQVIEAPGSHAIYVSNPEVVAAVIKQAAEKVAGSTR
ncbi:alpha/beta fold hydrolase [Edaphobacter modestus]|uniref:alpha/beta fold hydrolase n=1 Tax=Edaphobacter modestus TaxID=388466 RepID=UPI003BF78E37